MTKKNILLIYFTSLFPMTKILNSYICENYKHKSNLMSRKGFIFILALMVGNQIAAQNFEVAPVDLTFSPNPGENQTKTITIKNHGNEKASIVLSLQDYLVYKNGEKKILSAGSSKNSIAEWITLNPSYLELNPNQSQPVEVTLQAPNDDYTSKWGILNVSTTKEQTSFEADKELTAGINIYGRISVHLSYTPRTGTNKRVQISNLQETTAPSDSLRKFTVNIDNLGNHISNCKIYLIASNLQTLQEKKFKPVKLKSYPQSTRNVELTLPADKLPSGTYSLSAILDYGNDRSLEGTQTTIEVD